MAETHEELYKLVKQIIHETDGWTMEKVANGLAMHSKPMNNLSIGCYRIVDQGVVSGKDAKKMADHMLSWTEKDAKEFDPSTKSWKKLSQDPEIIYQANSLPWPLATREFLVQRQRFSDDEGEWIVSLDATHPDAPSEKGAVKARSVINANVFLKVEGGVKCARVVQVDPAGSIPAFVVNAKATDFMGDVEKMKKFPG